MGSLDVDQMSRPVIYDLGKTRQRQIKDLKRHRGKLVNEVNEVVEQVRAALREAGSDKQIVPVVIIYRRKAKKRRSGGSGFPFLGF